MQISKQGLLELASYEGLSTKPYLDSKNIWTTGIGKTSADGKKITKSTPEISIKQAVDWYKEDIKSYEKTVNNVVTVPLTQEQYDALVSFQYNTGGLRILDNNGRMKDSTLLKKLNTKSPKEEIKAEFMKWTKVTINGKKIAVKGLYNRRVKEADLFCNSVYSNDGTTTLIRVNPSTYKPIYDKKINIKEYL